MIADPQTIKTYNRIAAAYSASRISSYWMNQLKRFHKMLPQGSIIDIGCGSGREAPHFVRWGYSYTGIDASEALLDEARKKTDKARFLFMDYYDLDFPKETFDGFWAAASLLHIPKKELPQALTQIKKIIRQGGIGFISVKEGTHPEGWVEEKKYGGIGRFFAFYQIDEFQKILERASFEVVYSEKFRKEQKDWLCFFVKRI